MSVFFYLRERESCGRAAGTGWDSNLCQSLQREAEMMARPPSSLAVPFTSGRLTTRWQIICCVGRNSARCWQVVFPVCVPTGSLYLSRGLATDLSASLHTLPFTTEPWVFQTEDQGHHVSSREKTSANPAAEADGGAAQARGEHQQGQREPGEWTLGSLQLKHLNNKVTAGL